MPALLDTPDRNVAIEALTWPERARAAIVTDAPSYSLAGELLLGIKALRRKIAETFDPHIARAFAAHRALTKEKGDAEAPLTEAEGVLKTALVSYDQAQQRIQREEQARQDRIAREQAERDALARAVAMEAEGRQFGDDAMVAEAHALVEQAIAAPAPALPFVPKATPKVAGIAMRTTWSCQCADLAALIRFVAAHPEHTNLLTFNQSAGNALARAQGERMNILGLRAVATQGVAAGW